MPEGMTFGFKTGDKIRFSLKGKPREWSPGVIIEEVPIPEYPEDRFYRVVSKFRLSPPQTEMIGTRRFDIESV